MDIRSTRYPGAAPARFSILVPTWNNLPYLRLCIESIRRHSAFAHQIIVHVNEGTDGTLEWVRGERLDHSASVDNVGICHALNAAARLATTSHIVYFNDDMYALPGWDRALADVMATIGHDRWFLSSTMIEPRDTGNDCVIAHDYGQHVETFRERDLLSGFENLEKQDWSGATWPPNIVPRSLWEEVGGYSVEFSPGMSSDPDFAMKLWQSGVRHFQGVGPSRVYHFQAKSTGKVQKNSGARQFLDKWGVSQRAFARYYLRRGRPWSGPLPEAGPALGLALAKFRSRLTRIVGGNHTP